MSDTKSRLFEGAGIVICKPNGAEPREGAIIVKTQHAEEVSDLTFALKSVFDGSLDYLNKYEFYERLANAANDQLRADDDFEALREAIVGEACSIADEMGSHLYFAYGSNMDADQMSYRCLDAIFVGTAELHDHAFELDSAGVATVVERRGSMVPGVIWLISQADEDALDGYEGVEADCYRKATRWVVDDAGRNLQVLVYISNRDIHDGVTYRSGYLDQIIASAKRLGFDAEYIEHLEAQ